MDAVAAIVSGEIGIEGVRAPCHCCCCAQVVVPPAPPERADRERLPVEELVAGVRRRIDMQRFSPEQLAAFDEEDFRHFSNRHIGYLDERQIQSLTPEQIEHDLSAYHLSGLTRRQIRWMDAEQRAALFPKLPASKLQYVFCELPPEETLDVLKTFTSEQMAASIPAMTVDQSLTLKTVVRTQSKIIEEAPLRAFFENLQPRHIPALFPWDMMFMGASRGLWRFMLQHLPKKTFKRLVDHASRENKALIFSTISEISHNWHICFVHDHPELLRADLQVRLGLRPPATFWESKQLHLDEAQSEKWKERFESMAKKRKICLKAKAYAPGENDLRKAEAAQDLDPVVQAPPPLVRVEIPLPEGRTKKEIQAIPPGLLASHEPHDWENFNAGEIGFLTSHQCMAITPDQWANGLTDDQIDALTWRQVRYLNEEQWLALLPRLSPSQLAPLVYVIRSKHMPALFQAMTLDQIAIAAPHLTNLQVKAVAPFLQYHDGLPLSKEKLAAFCAGVQPHYLKHLFPSSWTKIKAYNRVHCGMSKENWKLFLTHIPKETFKAFLLFLPKEGEARAITTIANMRRGQLSTLSRRHSEHIPQSLQRPLTNASDLLRFVVEFRHALPCVLKRAIDRLPENLDQLNAMARDLPEEVLKRIAEEPTFLIGLIQNRHLLPEKMQRILNRVTIIIGGHIRKYYEWLPDEIQELMDEIGEPLTFDQMNELRDAFRASEYWTPRHDHIETLWTICNRGPKHWKKL